MSFEEIKMEEDESFDEFYAKLKDIVCKVEFNQPSCWLYSIPNLLVI